jgi:sugar transferase EpsL
MCDTNPHPYAKPKAVFLKRSNWYCAWGKRSLDIGLCLLALPLLLPVMLAVATGVWIMIGNPVLFRQMRPGLRGKTFQLLKFRTMNEERDSLGQLKPDAERLTPWGRILRSTSLDELPEVIHVLRGEMSLVGPRPLLTAYLSRYNDHQRRRHDVKPGLTGWAQVNGRNAISWPQKFDLDIWYVDNMSLWLDMRILATTVLQVVRRKDIRAEGEATMPEFLGNPTVSDQGRMMEHSAL